MKKQDASTFELSRPSTLYHGHHDMNLLDLMIPTDHLIHQWESREGKACRKGRWGGHQNEVESQAAFFVEESLFVGRASAPGGVFEHRWLLVV